MYVSLKQTHSYICHGKGEAVSRASKKGGSFNTYSHSVLREAQSSHLRVCNATRITWKHLTFFFFWTKIYEGSRHTVLRHVQTSQVIQSITDCEHTVPTSKLPTNWTRH
ncbi:unnamed protein product [Allacma fusca]|uniref:Uncharacterized protein n=1 Tax=Allacma fusca TaxID=39272 RepID=A0A8J2P0G2_9HEXA|nr:unnamed protein product [Allacma fusca]